MVKPDELMDFTELLATNGTAGVIGILLLLVVGLIWERLVQAKHMNKIHKDLIENKEKEIESIKKIIEKYHNGNLDLSKTLTEIRVVLDALQRR